MSMLNRLVKYASSPQGRKLANQAARYAQSPQGRRKIAELRGRLAGGKGTPKRYS
jgi:hypothetical protein